MIARAFLAVWALCVAGCAFAARPAAAPLASAPSLWAEPPLIRSSAGTARVKLTVRIAAHRGTPEFAYFMRTSPYWFDGAPTLEVRPGDRLAIEYHDVLPPIVSDEAHGLPDDTNIHFHGLTVSPNPPADDVLNTVISPLGVARYDVRVQPDQPPGLYWYHPHAHHETSWQVGSGMSGAIVIDGIQNVVPAVAGLRQRLLIVREIFSHPEADEHAHPHPRHTICGLGNLSQADQIRFLRAHPELAAEADDKLSTEMTVNGRPAGTMTIGIAPGERELFRLLNATSHRNLDVGVDGRILQLVAQDGVPLGMLPGAATSQRVGAIVVPPGGRAEFIVTGSARPAVLRSRAFDSGPKGDANPPFAIASLADDSGRADDGDRLPQRAPRDVTHPDFYGTWPGTPAVRRTVLLSENSSGTQFFINHRSFDMRDAPMFTARAGTVEEWTIANDSREIHTFHAHQVHFIVESIDGRTIPRSERHWADTANVPYKRGTIDGSIRILVDLRDPVIRGIFVFHCHILDHEDGGMMAKLRVV